MPRGEKKPLGPPHVESTTLGRWFDDRIVPRPKLEADTEVMHVVKRPKLEADTVVKQERPDGIGCLHESVARAAAAAASSSLRRFDGGVAQTFVAQAPTSAHDEMALDLATFSEVLKQTSIWLYICVQTSIWLKSQVRILFYVSV